MALILLIVIVWLFVKGLFKIVLPLLVIVFLAKLLLGGALMLFTPHFWGALLVIGFIVWLVRASRGRRYY